MSSPVPFSIRDLAFLEDWGKFFFILFKELKVDIKWRSAKFENASSLENPKSSKAHTTKEDLELPCKASLALNFFCVGM